MTLCHRDQLIAAIIKRRKADPHLENTINEEHMITFIWQLLYHSKKKKKKVYVCVHLNSSFSIISYLFQLDDDSYSTLIINLFLIL